MLMIGLKAGLRPEPRIRAF